MKRKEFKETLFETLNNVVDGMSYDYFLLGTL